jgi:hypothetical protein
MPEYPFIVFLAVGLILLAYGLNLAGSGSSYVAEGITGLPTNKSIWLIALGVTGAIAGGFGLLLSRNP